MRVLKFGGTSLANPERFSQAGELILQAHLKDQAAAVLSAPAKITNYLVALVDKTNKGEDKQQDVKEAKQIFENILSGLKQKNAKFDDEKLRKVVQQEFDQIESTLSQFSSQSQCPDNINASIISRGEKLSIAMMAAWFEAQGYQVHVIDPVKQLLAQGEYLESSVDIEESTKRINAPS